jgi:hypothetical protein
MDQQNYRDRQVRAKTRQVVDYHNDDEKPGKPLHLLIPGGLIALGALAVIVLIAYQVWWENTMAQDQGLTLIAILAPFYIGGVFLFSYGYELYDIPRALRLTAIIVFVTLAAVVIVAVLVVVLGAGGKTGSSSKSSRSRSSSSGGKLAKATPPTTSGGNWGGGVGPVFLGGFPGGTHTETREVIREVPVEPAKPQPATCPNCGRSYIPEENGFLCPGCGAPSPKQDDRAEQA